MTLGEAVAEYYRLGEEVPRRSSYESVIATAYRRIICKEPFRSTKLVDVRGSDGRWYCLTGVFRPGVYPPDPNGIAVACLDEISDMEIDNDAR